MATERSGQIWSNSDAYEAIMGRWSRPAGEAVVAWLNLPTGLRWLDVGCGTGALTEVILANAEPAAVLGVEPSSEFLATAREQIHDDRVTFSSGSALELPAHDASVDVIISGLVLHFLSDPRLALVEMARTARPGGTVAGYIWAITDESHFTRPFWRAALDLDASAAEWDLVQTNPLNELERLSSLFASAELEQVSAANLSFPVLFQDFDDYWLPCLLDGTTPIQRYVRSLTADRQEALRERLRSELPIAPDGSIALLGLIWVASGVKAV